ARAHRAPAAILVMAPQACKITTLHLKCSNRAITRQKASKDVTRNKTETGRLAARARGCSGQMSLEWGNGALSPNVPPERCHPCAEGCLRRGLQRRRRKSPHNTIRRGRAVAKGLKKTVRRRKPTLRAA